MSFHTLNIDPAILDVLAAEHYHTPTPIQADAIPQILKGRDLLATSQTGTGKTAAFAIPTLQTLAGTQGPKGAIRALVLTPTRELALQIHTQYRTYGRNLSLRTAVIFGGVSQKPQETELRRGVDILVATPGRLVDLMGQGLIDLRRIEILILDEADRMLDMGFIHDVKRILKPTPDTKQTLLFSATMPPAVSQLAKGLLRNPHRIDIRPEQTTVEAIAQELYHVPKAEKRDLLRALITERGIETALVFTRTKHGADRVAKDLNCHGIGASAIHGNKSQNARVRALDAFKDRRIRVLVATDIAARGIDIDALSYVFNFDLPDVPEAYVHRIGRTGRAGRSGIAISFCDDVEQKPLRDIERFIRCRIPVVAVPAAR